MNIATDILQWISNSLMLPDIFLLLVLMAMTVMRLGGFAGEAIARLRSRGAFVGFVRQLKRSRRSPVQVEDVPANYGLPRRAMAELKDTFGHSDKTLEDLQLQAEASLKKLHIGIRIGPMLGLVGTLIPLGPALRGLAGGDLNMLANNLIVAFATPVVGITIGGLSFFMHTVRQRWYNHDLNDIEFVVRCIAADRTPAPAGSER